ncbi:HAD family hydrolase [Brevundimonas sp. BR2-1]|uniref:HAD family hydrolase n=1 Tax=Brevundimonas sp. BR2-1 TaxID=3031123 RepID=UPI0030A1B605
MLKSDLADTVVVLDLDDTLYPEEAYVRSGILAACALAGDLYGVDHGADLLSLRDAGQRDWLTALCSLLPAGIDTRDALLWAYRLHRPDIALATGVRETVAALETHARSVAILTDGRSITQRLKLGALGLDHLPVYISDEYGGAFKPDQTRFRAVMADFPADQYVYVADNPAKDFAAPNALGWSTIGVRGNEPGVHSQGAGTAPDDNPDCWIAGVADLLGPEERLQPF